MVPQIALDQNVKAASLTDQYPTIDFGQIYAYDSPNQHGAIPYLWATAGSTYQMYDAFSGNWILDINNVPGRNNGLQFRRKYPEVYTKHTEWLVISMEFKQGNLVSKESFRTNENWMWRPPLGETVDGRNGFEWNVTIPKVEGFGNLAIRTISDGIIVASQVNQDTYPYPLHSRGYDATTGAQLWVNDIITPHERPSYGPSTDGVFTLFIRDTVTVRGFDIKTGNQLWETDPMDGNAWDMYGGPMTAAYGKLYAGTYGGHVYCYQMISGELLFDYFVGSAGLETPYGHYPFRYDLVLADGKFYGTTSEHSPTSPLYRGEGLHAVDANSGDLVWFIKGWWDNPAIADGYLVVHNAYDNRLYTFGKGETKTTVSVQDDIIDIGDSIMIKGMVTDESAGAKQTEQVARYPNGVPAIGDEYMTEWMEHLYMQQSCPMMINGVNVKLENT